MNKPPGGPMAARGFPLCQGEGLAKEGDGGDVLQVHGGLKAPQAAARVRPIDTPVHVIQGHADGLPRPVDVYKRQ